MEDFQQSLSLSASPEAAYAALATIDGLRNWWTQECDGVATAGGTIHFRFGNVYKDMRVDTAVQNREVRWTCTRACIDVPSLSRKDEWVGTRLVFRLTESTPGKTTLDFEHTGLVPSFECYQMCVTGWRHFLGSLQQYLETGSGMPHLAQTQCQERSLAA
jgi:uncharacterized protein YndB with AHSA1/START domain